MLFFRRLKSVTLRSAKPVNRCSRSEVFLVKGVLKICNKFTGEHPCRSVISIKLQSIFTEIIFRHGYSPVNLLFSEHLFLRTFLDGCFWVTEIDKTKLSSTNWYSGYFWRAASSVTKDFCQRITAPASRENGCYGSLYWNCKLNYYCEQHFWNWAIKSVKRKFMFQNK